LTAKDRFTASLLGAAAGGAIGSQFVGKKRGSYQVALPVDVGDMKSLSLTGPIALMLCLAETLAEFGLESDSEYIFMRKAGALRRNGCWMPAIPASRHERVLRTRGRERQDAPVIVADRVPQINRPSPVMPGNVNGALAWIAPLAYLLKDSRSFSFRLRHIERFCAIEGQQARCTLACVIFVEFLVGLYRDLSISEALALASDEIAPLSDNQVYAREFPSYFRIFDRRVLGAPKNSIRSGEYAAETLEAVLWSLGHSASFTECLVEAVSLGGDTVSTAAIAGGAAGVAYGLESIGPEWLALIPQAREIDGLSHMV